MSSVGDRVWCILTFISRCKASTLLRYKKATIDWLNDPDTGSSIDKFGISIGTYRKFMRTCLTTEFPLVAQGTDWKLKLFSLVDIRPCSKCNTLRNLFDDYNLGQRVCKCCQQKYREANRDRQNCYTKAHYQNNKGDYKERAAQRRLKQANATPLWANLSAIREIYANCQEGYEVDHIIPINGYTVCGLHVEYNLQYLPKEENRAKSNKLNGGGWYGQ